MATDYAAIAAKKIRKPGERKPRLLIYGRYKQGKTTLVATAGKVLIVDPEGGADFLPKDGPAQIWPITSWEDINEIFQYLKSGKHDYEWVALDGMTRISNMALRHVMKLAEDNDLSRIPGMVQQRDYGKAGELIKGMLYNYHTLPMGIIYTAHDRMDSGSFDDNEDEDSEAPEVRFVPDLPRGARTTLNSVVDLIGRIYTVPVEVTNTKTGVTKKVVQRRLWIAPNEKYDTGYRAKRNTPLPDYIKKPTIPALLAEMNKEN